MTNMRCRVFMHLLLGCYSFRSRQNTSCSFVSDLHPLFFLSCHILYETAGILREDFNTMKLYWLTYRNLALLHKLIVGRVAQSV